MYLNAEDIRYITKVNTIAVFASKFLEEILNIPTQLSEVPYNPEDDLCILRFYYEAINIELYFDTFSDPYSLQLVCYTWVYGKQQPFALETKRLVYPSYRRFIHPEDIVPNIMLSLRLITDIYKILKINEYDK